MVLQEVNTEEVVRNSCDASDSSVQIRGFQIVGCVEDLKVEILSRVEC